MRSRHLQTKGRTPRKGSKEKKEKRRTTWRETRKRSMMGWATRKRRMVLSRLQNNIRTEPAKRAPWD
jgi:hypothetical protein